MVSTSRAGDKSRRGGGGRPLEFSQLLSLTILQQASTDAAATHSLMLKKYEARWIALSAGTRFRSSHSAGDLFAPE